jgi:DNA replication and repair protein RecF
MWLERLVVEQFRLFERLDVAPDPGLNLFTGPNGAGKTSLLEAVYLLGYGRSFRGAVRDGLIRRGQPRLRIVADLRDANAEPHRLGLERSVRDWQARVDGEAVSSLSELYRALAVVCFEPGSHALISGGSELRRRFVDWGLFHVEPDFLVHWRRYQRALRQRNMLLKSGQPDPASLAAWEQELSEAGERLTQQRQCYLRGLADRLAAAGTRFLPGLGVFALRFERGWPESARSLGEALRASRSRDLAVGHTTVGPHRADWTPGFEQLPEPETFSRGQEKLAALACVLAQAEGFAEGRGQWPILVLDDLASELDQARMGAVLARLSEVPAQILLTGTDAPAALGAWTGTIARFHVEQGEVRRLL